MGRRQQRGLGGGRARDGDQAQRHRLERGQAQNHGLTQSILYGVWLSGRTDVWAVGDRVTLHYDGSGWASVTNALDIGTSVWGSASDDVWSIGRSTAPDTTFISRFNGVQWLAATNPTTMPLQAVRGSSAANVWAVGNGGTVLRLQVP